MIYPVYPICTDDFDLCLPRGVVPSHQFFTDKHKQLLLRPKFDLLTLVHGALQLRAQRLKKKNEEFIIEEPAGEERLGGLALKGKGYG